MLRRSVVKKSNLNLGTFSHSRKINSSVSLTSLSFDVFGCWLHREVKVIINDFNFSIEVIFLPFLYQGQAVRTF